MQKLKFDSLVKHSVGLFSHFSRYAGLGFHDIFMLMTSIFTAIAGSTMDVVGSEQSIVAIVREIQLAPTTAGKNVALRLANAVLAEISSKIEAALSINKSPATYKHADSVSAGLTESVTRPTMESLFSSVKGFEKKELNNVVTTVRT